MQITFPELPEKIGKLEMAKADWLYGEPGKKPLRDTEALARKYGLATLDIARHSSAWIAELRANAQCASAVYGKAISPEIIESYENDVGFLREQLDRLAKKISDIEDSGIGLENHEFYMKQWLRANARWSQLSGVEGMLKIATLAKLTLAREEVKLAIAAEMEKPPPPDGSNARPVSGEVFDMSEG